MERTKEYSVVNDTLKALKNQGLSERYFQKGHSFSSADPSTTWVHLQKYRKAEISAFLSICYIILADLILNCKN